MRVKSLKLKNFRNQDSIVLDFPEDVVLISGDNGTGKTSILEAINIIASTKSFKAKKDIDLIKKGRDFAYVSLLKEDSDLRELAISFEKASESRVKRLYKIDNVSKRSVSFIGDLITVLFTTDLVNDFNDKAIIRRRFFNQFLSQLDKTYLVNLSGYQKVLKNKSKLLRMIKDGADPFLIEYWNDQLVEFGSGLVISRKNFINSVTEFLNSHNTVLDNKIEISYITRYDGEEKSVKELIREDLQSHKKFEIDSARCLVGPHKDDYVVSFNKMDIKDFGSRGEQKFSLSLLLYSIAQYITEQKGTSPVVLLDDLAAEMDKKNVTALLNLFLKTDYQVIMTSVYPDHYDKHIKNHIQFPYQIGESK